MVRGESSYRLAQNPAMRPILPALALLLLAAPADAAQLTVYRCTDGAGHVSLRDTPCPAGLDEQAIDMQRPTDPPPAATAVAPAPTAPPQAPTPETRVVFVEAPRPMYQCTTPDGDRYSSDNADGNPRWVPLWTLGYSAYPPRNPLGDRVGAPRPRPPSAGPGAPDLPPIVGIAYTPGAWVRDHCIRLPDSQACDVLREQKRELREEWFNAMPTRRAEVAKEEHVLAERLARTCGS